MGGNSIRLLRSKEPFPLPSGSLFLSALLEEADVRELPPSEAILDSCVCAHVHHYACVKVIFATSQALIQYINFLLFTRILFVFACIRVGFQASSSISRVEDYL